MNSFQINDHEWAENVQRELDEYINALQSWYVYGEEEGEEPEPISGLPYCGCETCYWREVLAFVSPRIMNAQNSKQIELA
jgi:hypothetical protein